MNIFALSKDPRECAQWLDDRRLIKMVLETAQILSTAIRLNQWIDSPDLYKKTHQNHPTVKWCAAKKENWLWTFDLFIFLCQEYEWRFHKRHACETLLYVVFMSLHDQWKDLDAKNHADFVNVTTYLGYPVHEAYKRYMVDKWNQDIKPKWTRRGRPSWAILDDGEI